jgi:hypothetical protein
LPLLVHLAQRPLERLDLRGDEPRLIPLDEGVDEGGTSNRRHKRHPELLMVRQLRDPEQVWKERCRNAERDVREDG